MPATYIGLMGVGAVTEWSRALLWREKRIENQKVPGSPLPPARTNILQLTLSFPEPPLHLRDQVLQTVAAGVDQLQLVLDVALLGLRRQRGEVALAESMKASSKMVDWFIRIGGTNYGLGKSKNHLSWIQRRGKNFVDFNERLTTLARLSRRDTIRFSATSQPDAVIRGEFFLA